MNHKNSPIMVISRDFNRKGAFIFHFIVFLQQAYITLLIKQKQI